MNDLAVVLLDRMAGPDCVLRYGTVVTADPLTITVGASTVAVPAKSLAGYVAVGSYIAVLEQGADRLVLGRVGGSASHHYATAAGGTVAASTSATVLSLVVPAAPAGTRFTVTWTIKVGQATAGAFDVSFVADDTSALIHQEGAGVPAIGRVLSATRPWLADGTTQAFSVAIYAWGGQAVTWAAQSSIVATIGQGP